MLVNGGIVFASVAIGGRNLLLPVSQILKRRHLEEPNGKPLYTYRCTDDEYEAVAQYVRQRVSPFGFHGRDGPAHFCLFASEWWRRNYTGGPWAWEPVLTAANMPHVNFTDLYPSIDNGLRFWKRELMRNHHRRMFLVTLACEGGLPLGLVQREGTHLRSYFFHLLDDYSQFRGSGITAQELAANIAHRIPASLRQDVVYELSGCLVEKIWILHEIVGDTPTPILELDSQFPDWRDELPLNVEDDTARTLFNSLLREAASVVKRGGRPIRVIRGLRMSSSAPSMETHLNVPSRLSAELITDLLDLPKDHIPSSFQLWIENDKGDREFCALVNELGREDKGYRVESPFSTGQPILHSDDPNTSWRICATQDGTTLAVQSCRGGSPLRDAPWAFGPEEEGWRPLIAQGNFSTTADSVVIAIRQQGSTETSADEPRFLGSLERENRKIIEVSQDLELVDESGRRWRIRTETTRSPTFEYRLVGPTIDIGRNSQPVFVGIPEVRAYKNQETTTSTTVSRDRIHLNPIGGHRGEKQPDHDDAYGEIWLEVDEDGSCVSRQRISVVPDSFSLDVNPGVDNTSGTIELAGLHGATVSAQSGDNFSCRSSRQADGVWSIVATTTHAITPSSVSANIEWPKHGGHLTVDLPFPIRHSHFEDRSGDLLAPDTLVAVDRIHRINAVAVSPDSREQFSVEGKLIAEDVPLAVDVSVFLGMTADRIGRRSGDLRRLAEELDRLLSFSNALDAWVRLRIESSQGQLRPLPLRVARYDTEFSIDRVNKTLSIEGAAEPCDLFVECIPLWDPGTSPIRLEQLENQQTWQLPMGVPSGPWLAIGRTGSWVRTRPTLVPTSGGAAPEIADLNDLQRAILVRNQDERNDALATSLDSAVTGSDADALSTFRSLLDLAETVHPSALDPLVVLASKPETAVRAVIRSRPEIARAIWRTLGRLRFSWYIVPASSYLAEIQNYSQEIRKELERIDPRLAARVIHGAANALFVQAEWLRPIREWFEVYMAPNKIGLGPELLMSATRSEMGRNILEKQLRDLASEMIHRRSGIFWPSGDQIIERLQMELKMFAATRDNIGEFISGFVDIYERFRWPVIAAPIVAAAISAHASVGPHPLSNATLSQILRSRAFDNQWFDEAYSRTLALWMERVRNLQPEVYPP